MDHYKVQHHSDKGYGTLSLYLNGDWVSTHHTQEELDAERKTWEEFRAIWWRDHRPLDD